MSTATAYSHHRFAMPEDRSGARPRLVSRLLAAVRDARTRQAEREIARFIEGQGGRITDALERRIERHFV